MLKSMAAGFFGFIHLEALLLQGEEIEAQVEFNRDIQPVFRETYFQCMSPLRFILHLPSFVCHLSSIASPMRLAVLPISLLALTASAADYFPPSDAQGGWRTPKDKAEARALAGIDLDRLDQAYHATERSNTENGGLVVISKGYLVLEKYFGKAHRNANPDMASTGKGFTSIACGVMLSPARRPGDRVGPR